MAWHLTGRSASPLRNWSQDTAGRSSVTPCFAPPASVSFTIQVDGELVQCSISLLAINELGGGGFGGSAGAGARLDTLRREIERLARRKFAAGRSGIYGRVDLWASDIAHCEELRGVTLPAALPDQATRTLEMTRSEVGRSDQEPFKQVRPSDDVRRKPTIVWLWTAAGACFGYRLGDELWSSAGRHCGRFMGNHVFDQTGAYRGETLEDNRLVVDPAKRALRGERFTPSLGWVGMPARRDQPPRDMPAGYTDFT